MGLPRSQMSLHHQPLSLIVLICLISFVFPVRNQELEPPGADTSIKCGTCPCVNPCAQLPPPPPPPPSPPPPPPSPPPPPKTTYCTPLAPPPPRFTYMTCMPGQICQTGTDNWGFYSRAGCNVAKKLLGLAGFGVLAVLIW